jgi:tRNA (guanine37-N1)-methyltransferase
LGLRSREISVGDFVCNGGEVPAMVVIDTVVRTSRACWASRRV